MSLQNINKGNNIKLPKFIRLNKSNPFRIISKKDKRKEYIRKIPAEITKSQKLENIPVIHIDEMSNVHLVPGRASDTQLGYNAGKKHLKQIDFSKKIKVFYFDGHCEEGFLTDSFNPTNIKVNPSLDETVKPIQTVFINALHRQEIDYVRKSMLNLSKEQQKMLILMFLSGMGIASLVWVGAIVLLFLM